MFFKVCNIKTIYYFSGVIKSNRVLILKCFLQVYQIKLNSFEEYFTNACNRRYFNLGFVKFG